MPSIGDRPWATAAFATFTHYAEHHDAEAHLVTELPPRREFPLPKLPKKPGRRNKAAYALKTFLAWEFLVKRDYHRVAIVDDSCCVKPDAPWLFDQAPEGYCGYTGTQGVQIEKSFSVIRKFIEDNNLSPIVMSPDRYPNSGVMIYDHSTVHAISPEKIIECVPLLFASHPHQTLIYYLLHAFDVPLWKIDKKFNMTPASGIIPIEARRQMMDASQYLDDLYIAHFTGAYRHRDILIRQASEMFLGSTLPRSQTHPPAD